MAVHFARPDIADLVLCAFERRLHPELFECRAERLIQQHGVVLALRLCAAGHWMEFSYGDRFLTEAICERQVPLPSVKRVSDHRLKGGRTQTFTLASGARYTTSCQLERLEPVVFLQVHEELLVDCRKADLSIAAPRGNRWSPGPLSLLRTEVERNSVLIHAFHTFPEFCAVIKTQTLVEAANSAW